jgi:hypothetical protein
MAIPDRHFYWPAPFYLPFHARHAKRFVFAVQAVLVKIHPSPKSDLKKYDRNTILL